MRLKKIFLAILVFFGLYLPTFASHIRAGDITAIRTGTLTYCFRVTLYTDDDSGADSPFLDIDFGDNTPFGRIDRCKKTPLGNATSVGYYGFVPGGSCTSFCHTFPGPGIYIISFTEQNRQAGVQNIPGSVNVPFSINVIIDINPSFGLNTSPILSVPPIDRACVGQSFSHNPGAYDTDGDSLVFKLVTPKKGRIENVTSYSSPENTHGGTVEGGTAPATFKINAITGDLIWNAPFKAGTYNIAFVVEEWRFGVKIGQTTRDMQIIVLDCNNKRPKLVVEDVCIVADDNVLTTANIIQRDIIATDPDITPPPKDNLYISSSPLQQVYTGFIEKATFTFAPIQTSPARGVFRWDTRAEHVQRQPYIVIFKVEDGPPARGVILSDIQSMLITVKGTPVQNVTALPNGKKMNLAWGNYKTLCPTFTAAQFDKMEYVVWRREGCSGTVPCIQNPSQVGYTQIGKQNLNTESFIDNGPLKAGLSYSYIITVKYPESRGGESQASIEVCASIPILTPILTKASVKSTNTTSPTAEMEVSWLRPKPTLPLATFNTQFLPPYKYELYRAEGFSSNTFTLIHTVNDATGGQINFDFTDTGLDTKAKPYLYRVAWYTSAGLVTQARMLDSDSTSSVQITATPALNSIILTWDYNTTWTNQNFLHEIYRGEEGQLKSAYLKIGQVLVGQRKFIDDGTFGNICLDPLKVYGYYVKTKGSYSNIDIPEPVALLRNDSQQAFASPLDNTPPPPPILNIDSLKCASIKNDCSTPTVPITPKNSLFWQPVKSGNKCQDFIAYYKLYFKAAGKETFVLLSPTSFPQPYVDTFYVHTDLPTIRPGILSQAGCYYVTAVDQNNNESAASNIVCQDNCLYFQLPNVFTPTGDGKNDTFRACPTPQFVEKVTFSVYNRWGGLVYRGDNDIEVNWDGKNQQGQDLPATTYYYEAKVEFVTIDEAKRVQLFKGWVNLMR